MSCNTLSPASATLGSPANKTGPSFGSRVTLEPTSRLAATLTTVSRTKGFASTGLWLWFREANSTNVFSFSRCFPDRPFRGPSSFLHGPLFQVQTHKQGSRRLRLLRGPTRRTAVIRRLLPVGSPLSRNHNSTRYRLDDRLPTSYNTPPLSVQTRLNLLHATSPTVSPYSVHRPDPPRPQQRRSRGRTSKAESCQLSFKQVNCESCGTGKRE